MNRHGPHQEAVKSTTIYSRNFISVFLKLRNEKINHVKESQMKAVTTQIKHKPHFKESRIVLIMTQIFNNLINHKGS